jgi:nucleotide-binding universal stress UspA family protein
VVVTVREPGLADLLAGVAGLALRSPSGALTAEAARVGRDAVADLARAGAELAVRQGATAETVAVNDAAGVASAIASEAERLDVCAVVIGSRGLGPVSAPLLGSTSQAVLRNTNRPVVVVRAPN